MSKYSLQNWEVIIDKPEVLISSNKDYICKMFLGTDKNKIKERANLIAAAPELLECLQTATKIMKSGGLPVPVNFTKAIKKARGEDINE